MARLPVVLAAALAVSAACGGGIATQESEPETRAQTAAVPESAAAAVVPENPGDRGIRRDLNLAIARDAELKSREISFIVSNGDVSVTGTVRTEEERAKINDLAMNIVGVKSIANALRVEE